MGQFDGFVYTVGTSDRAVAESEQLVCQCFCFGIIGSKLVFCPGDQRKEPHTPPGDDDSLFVPFAMPLVAGPGAITVVITLASQVDSWQATSMALIAVAANVLIMGAAFVFLAGYLAKLSDRVIGIFTRFGGLIVATIGVQLAFNGIKSFFELGVSP